MPSDWSTSTCAPNRSVGRGSRGIYVDDLRYGRVLISWDAFDRVDFGGPGAGHGTGGPAWGDFQPGGPLTGIVTTHAGRRLAGHRICGADIRCRYSMPILDAEIQWWTGAFDSYRHPRDERPDAC